MQGLFIGAKIGFEIEFSVWSSKPTANTKRGARGNFQTGSKFLAESRIVVFVH